MIQRRKALVGPFIDFVLLGGFSIILFCILLLDRFKVLNLGIKTDLFLSIFPVLRIAIDFPHFIASYHLAYSRGIAFTVRHWKQLILLPCFLLFLVFAFSFSHIMSVSSNFLGDLNANLVALMVGVAYFIFGWHRSRQVYGGMIYFSIYGKMNLSNYQKNIINYFLLSVWILGYCLFMQNASSLQLYGIAFERIEIPGIVMNGAIFIFSTLLYLNGREFIWKRLIQLREEIPILFFIQPLALFLWWLALLLVPNYFYYLAPSFHSLQYMGFVAGYKTKKTAQEWLKFTVVYLIYCLCGYLFLNLIPVQISSIIGNATNVATFTGYFLGLFYVAISLHHYFIDSVIWKTDDLKVAANVLK